jgi:hypothetical protein
MAQRQHSLRPSTIPAQRSRRVHHRVDGGAASGSVEHRHVQEIGSFAQYRCLISVRLPGLQIIDFAHRRGGRLARLRSKSAHVTTVTVNLRQLPALHDWRHAMPIPNRSMMPSMSIFGLARTTSLVSGVLAFAATVAAQATPPDPARFVALDLRRWPRGRGLRAVA